MMSFKNARNIRGMTLVEVLIALGIATVLLASLATIMTGMSKRVKRDNNKFDAMSEEIIAEHFLVADLTSSTPSLGNLFVPDDSSRQNFFDYYSDIPIHLVPSSQRTRTITLKPGSTRKSLVLLVSSQAETPPRMIDPAMAYASLPPSDPLQSGSLQYQSLNWQGIMESMFPSNWKIDELFLLYSPVPLRPPTASDVQAPRNLAFLGRVKGKDLEYETIGGLFQSNHPAIPSRNILKPDTFFRLLPPIGGAAAVVLMQPVRAIQYYFEEDPKNPGTGRILRSIWRDKAFTDPNVIANKVTQLKFERPSVSSPVIRYELTMANPNGQSTVKVSE